MSNEFEIGEYVRTRSGDIIKANIDHENLTITDKGISFNFNDISKMSSFINNEIVKHSKDIIDLIELRDFVNGYKVLETYLDGVTKYIKLSNAYSKENNYSGVRTYSEDIKTILTHEQYEQNCYKMEDK